MGSIDFTTSELEFLINTNLSEIVKDRRLKGKCLQYAMYIFGETGCSGCNDDFSNIFKKLKQKGMEILSNKINRQFEFKDNYIGQIKFGGKHISNANLTDELALEFLANNPERIKCFKQKPENWEDLVNAFKGNDIQESESKVEEKTDDNTAVYNENNELDIQESEPKVEEKTSKKSNKK